MKNKKPDIALIRKYLNGELDARAMYELERLAQDDPYLMDVMMGMEMGDAEQHQASIRTIDQLIEARIQPVKVKRMVSWQSWSVAASVVVGVGIAGFLFFNNSGQQQPKDADKQAIQYRKKETKPSAEQKDETITNVPVIDKALPSGDNIAALSYNKSDFRNKNAKPKLSSSEVAELSTVDASIINPVALAANIPVKGRIIDSPAIAKLSDMDSNEVVVVGYGNALAGKIAGVQVTGARSVKMKATVKIHGVVTDAEDDIPLAGVAVKAYNSNVGTSTDAKGRFTITVPSGTKKLDVVTLGYKVKTISIEGKDSLSVPLIQENQSLSEVIVTGFQHKREKARPLIGWKAYRVYLKKNATVNDRKKGKVVVAFTVGANGVPANIRIVNGVNDSINQKAIELIGTGSRWVNDSDGQTKEIILEIKFH